MGAAAPLASIERVRPLLRALGEESAPPVLSGMYRVDVEPLIAYIGDVAAALETGENELVGLCARLVRAAAATVPFAADRPFVDARSEIWIAERLSYVVKRIDQHESQLDNFLISSGLDFDLDDCAGIADLLKSIDKEQYSTGSWLCCECAAFLYCLGVLEHLDVEAVLAVHAKLAPVVERIADALKHPTRLDRSIRQEPGAALFHLGATAHKLASPGLSIVPGGMDRATYLWSRVSISALQILTMPLPRTRRPALRDVLKRAHLLAAQKIAANPSAALPREALEQISEEIETIAREISCGWLDTMIGDTGDLRDDDDVRRLITALTYGLIGLASSEPAPTA